MLKRLWPDLGPEASPVKVRPVTGRNCASCGASTIRGERVILATTHAGAVKSDVEGCMKIKGASAIMVPSSVVTLDAIPLLGRGKTDHFALAKALRGRLGLELSCGAS
jgi:hypothetical protein